MDFLKEFAYFLKMRRKYWLVPLLVMGAALGALLFLTQGTALAPFIYTLF